MLFKLEVFQYAMSLDLNMEYSNIQLTEVASNLWRVPQNCVTKMDTFGIFNGMDIGVFFNPFQIFLPRVEIIFSKKTPFSEKGVQTLSKLTKNQNARSFAQNNGSEYLLAWCVASNEVIIHILRLK